MNDKQNIQINISGHGEDIKKLLETFVFANSNNGSFVSPNELEAMLDNHFKKVEEMVLSHLNPPTIVEKREEKRSSFNYVKFKNDLQKLKDDFGNGLSKFIEKIKGNVEGAKSATKHKVEDVRIAAFNVVAKNVRNINDTVKSFTFELEKTAGQLKEFTEKMDEKFAHRSKATVAMESTHQLKETTVSSNTEKLEAGANEQQQAAEQLNGFTEKVEVTASTSDPERLEPQIDEKQRIDNTSQLDNFVKSINFKELLLQQPLLEQKQDEKEDSRNEVFQSQKKLSKNRSKKPVEMER